MIGSISQGFEDAEVRFALGRDVDAARVDSRSAPEADVLRARLRRERAIRLEAERLGEAATERLYIAGEQLKLKTVELLVALDRAEAASRAKSAFLNRLRHELRTPLNGIGPVLQSLGDMATDMNDGARDLLRLAEGAYHELAETLETLLEVAQIGELPEPQARQFSISAVIRATVDDFTVQAQEAGIDLIVTPTSPTTNVHDIVIGDPALISRVLSALVKNAIHYAPGEPVEISSNAASGERSSHMVTFSVDDGGQGLDDHTISMVRDALSGGGDIMSGHADSLGLGLTLASLLVGSLGGQLDILPSSRQGLRATFTIPLTPAEFAAGAGPEAAQTIDRWPQQAGGGLHT